MFNTPGYDDAQMRFTNAELTEHLQELVIDKSLNEPALNGQIDHVFILEDLYKNVDDLTRSIAFV